MPRKTITTDEEVTPETVEDKLDQVILYLHRMERRDRARMIGSYIHGMIWLASIGLLFWSTWYFIAYGPQLMEEMTNKMIQQSMGINTTTSTDPEESTGFMKMIEDYMKGQE
jgi:hypothetical protein